MISLKSRDFLLCGCFIGLSIALTPSIRSEEFWTRSGHGPLQYVQNGDPSQREVEEWQIWLYKEGWPARGDSSGRWGTITGKTIESVKKHLEENQNFQRRYEKWAELKPDEYGYFNPFGPIAILKDTNKKPKPDIERYHKLADRLWPLIDFPWPLTPQLPYTKDYIDNLEMVQKQVAKLGDTLSRGGSIMSDALDALESQVTKVENQSPKNRKQQSASVASWMEWSWKDTDGDKMVQKIRVEDGRLVVTYQWPKGYSTYSAPLSEIKPRTWVLDHITGGQSLSSPASNSYWVVDLGFGCPVRIEQHGPGSSSPRVEPSVKLELFFPDKATAEQAAEGIKKMGASPSQ